MIISLFYISPELNLPLAVSGFYGADESQTDNFSEIRQ